MNKKNLVYIGVFIAVVIASYLIFRARKQPAMVFAPLKILPATVKHLQAPGLTNFYQMTSNVFSGSTPDSPEALAALKAHGIKTIISVEGVKPDVAAAKSNGMRYVHLPIGYGEVPQDTVNRIVKAAATLPGPIYVHCKIGLQRGPVGAAIVCMGTENWTPVEGTAWLGAVDTSVQYMGLYKTVAQFNAPSAHVLAQVSGDFPEESEVTGLALEMVKMESHYKELKLFRLAGYQKPASHPELDGADEARRVQKIFEDLITSPLAKNYDGNFTNRLAATAGAVDAMRASFEARPLNTNTAEANYRALSMCCINCHQAYRK